MRYTMAVYSTDEIYNHHFERTERWTQAGSKRQLNDPVMRETEKSDVRGNGIEQKILNSAGGLD